MKAVLNLLSSGMTSCCCFYKSFATSKSVSSNTVLKKDAEWSY
jgi:hypothetical protein